MLKIYKNKITPNSPPLLACALNTYKLLKLCSIVSNSRVSLFQLKELDILLATNISGKLILKELNLEIFLHDLNFCSFKPLTSIVPPILHFLSQHMSIKKDLLRVWTSHYLEYRLNLLQPNLSTFCVGRVERDSPKQQC